MTTTDADPDRACPHEDWAAFADIIRSTEEEGGPIVGYTVELKVNCTACDTPLVFFCQDAGMLRDRPAIGPSGTEIRLPARPQDTPETFGLQLPGVGINIGRGMVPDVEKHAGVDMSGPDDHGMLGL